MNSHKIENIEMKSNNIENASFRGDDLEGSKDVILTDTDDKHQEYLTTDDKDDPNKMLTEADFEKLPEEDNACSVFLNRFRDHLETTYKRHSLRIRWILGLSILALYLTYFIWAIICKTRTGTLLSVEGNVRLIWISVLIFVWVLYKIIKTILISKKVKINPTFEKPKWWEKFCKISFYVIIVVICLSLTIYIIIVLAIKSPYNLVSLIGIISLLLFCYIFSKAPHMINWRTVLLGILMQFIFAFFILTTEPGFLVFKFIGDRVSDLLSYTNAGTDLVFGTSFPQGNFAFRILPMIFFLSSLISVLYYLGIIQMVIIALGTVMQWFMGTTCAESLNAAANIFLGMTEAPLLIKPFLGRMTNSELHAVMTGGFATIAGTVLGAYIGYGAPANHLIAASVMSAPAALAVSKIMYPETKKSKNTKEDAQKLSKSPHQNIVEAATAGVSDSLPLVANIGANLIAFVSILALFNAILEWIGERACMTRKLTFELICSYLFWPLSLVMGVHIWDCRKVAELIGIKTFLNEFIAYERLGVLLNNRKIIKSLNISTANLTYLSDDIFISYINGTNSTLKGGILETDRSVVIATYALCGFANFGSIGIFLSSLSTMIPHRRADLSRMIIRAMISGNIACFLTACIAGLFYKGN